MNRKTNFANLPFPREERQLENVHIFFAVTCQGPLQDFESLIKFIGEKLPQTRLIYRKKSLNYLLIKKVDEEDAEK